MKVLERFVAIDNVCSWPQIRIDNEDNILLTGFNQPCHGKTEGDVDCYKSIDSGRFFEYIGTPVVHKKTTNRMNHFSGFANNGDFISVVSGYDNRPIEIEYDEEIYKKKYFHNCKIIPPILARSKDGGKTYTNTPFDLNLGNNGVIPFGEISKINDSTLIATVYILNTKEGKNFPTCKMKAAVVISRDDGYTWDEVYDIDNNINETAILAINENNIIAVSRTTPISKSVLYRSTDGGKSWTIEEDLTMIGQMPANLYKLNDGRILLTYGVRNNKKSISYRIGDAEGKNWSEPYILVDLPVAGDMGYPSTVQLKDDTLITAYYCDNDTNHNRYHTGIIRWEL